MLRRGVTAVARNLRPRQSGGDGGQAPAAQLYEPSGLAIDGRCGLTAIAHSKEEANRLAQQAQEAIAAEGERVQTEVVGGPA